MKISEELELGIEEKVVFLKSVVSKVKCDFAGSKFFRGGNVFINAGRRIEKLLIGIL